MGGRSNHGDAFSSALRYNLVSVNFEKLANTGKSEKMEDLYTYITSIEFKQRIEAIGEAFGSMQEEVEREKRWFQTKWARQENNCEESSIIPMGCMEIFRVVRSLPDLKTLELSDGMGEE